MKYKICKDCKQEMHELSCTKKKIMINGQVYWRDTSQYDINERCHDCGIINKKGNLHHFGCDMEKCPKCKGQLLSCDCRKVRVF